MAKLISENPDLVAPLFKIAFTVNDPISSRACWVMEFTARENLRYIFPHLDMFTSKINTVHLDSSVRPMAKICEYLIQSYFAKVPNSTQQHLSNKHLEQITTTCFDWLIGNHRVAPKAYSMTCLLLLGRKFEWILPELQMVLEKNYAQGSAAYKARARLTLKKMK